MEEEKKTITKKLLNTHTFTVDFTTPTGQELVGTFSVHRPNIGEQIRIGVIEARELGGLSNIDMSTSMIARMVATLEVVVDSHPEWWKPREIRDLEVLQGVYENYIDYLQQFSGRTQPKPETAG
jgi:hypothetical protein